MTDKIGYTDKEIEEMLDWWADYYTQGNPQQLDPTPPLTIDECQQELERRK